MFEDLDMTPLRLYKFIEEHCEGRYDTLELIEKTQHTHIISLTRSGYKDIEVKCKNPVKGLVKYEHAVQTIQHIENEYPERELVWWP